ncbi:hypothetical protein MUP79_08500 [Candidatus Bathyarchaeota archaeon]|nr:hypothetical protein [Candidatus Bathyarchaeota archaeon]
MSDSISWLVGSVCAKIHGWASEEAWDKLFKPSVENEPVLKEAVELSHQDKYELVFLALFKGIEAEAKRLLGKEYAEEKPEKIVSGLHAAGLLSEREFHFLNGLRALRNEVAHGRPAEADPANTVFLRSEIKAGILLAIVVLMRLQSKRGLGPFLLADTHSS